VLSSLLLYIAVYLVVYPIGLFVMLRVVWQGPIRSDVETPVASGHPKAPIEALANEVGGKP
jgi:cytochrome d ubiquinol oxidase subunit I